VNFKTDSKHWADINRRTLSERADPEYVFDYIDISAVGTGYLTSTPKQIRFKASPSRARRIVQQGDTLISTVRTYLKAIYHVDRPWPDLIASTGFAVLTPKPAIDARFFGFVLQSKTFVDQVIANSIGVAYPAISETRLGSLHYAFLRLDRTKKQSSAISRSPRSTLTRPLRQVNAKSLLFKNSAHDSSLMS